MDIVTLWFSRVYDNARANAVMQKAITILTIWEKLTQRQKAEFHKYVRDYCSPFDDDEHVREDAMNRENDMRKVAFQIMVSDI